MRLKRWSKCNATEGGEEHFVTSHVVVKWLPAAKLMGTAVCQLELTMWLVLLRAACTTAAEAFACCCSRVRAGKNQKPHRKAFSLVWTTERKERALSPPSYSGSHGETPQPGCVTPFPLPWGCRGHLSFSGLVPYSSAISLSLTEWFLLLKNVFVGAF